MAKADFISQNDDSFSLQLSTFKDAIPAYAASLGVLPAQVSDEAADSDYFSYVLASQKLVRNSSQWTGWKDIIRAGGSPPAGGRAGRARSTRGGSRRRARDRAAFPRVG